MSRKLKLLSEQLREQIRQAGERGLSRYRICKLVGFSEPSMSVFMSGGGLSLATIDKIGKLLVLEITRSDTSSDTTTPVFDTIQRIRSRRREL